MTEPSKRTPGPAKRTPGPAKRTAVAGHRQKDPHTPEQHVFYARWQLFAASCRPTAIALAAAMSLSTQTLRRKLKQEGRGLTPAQLTAGNALLDQCSPATWPAGDYDEAANGN